MTNPMMKCGCVAQGTLTAFRGEKLDEPIPACIVHDCFEIADDAPDLSGRQARCSCSKPPVLSNFDLAFFEYRGPGSRYGADTCKHCKYAEVAHRPEKKHKCKKFEPICSHQYDTYYCGHGGWD